MKSTTRSRRLKLLVLLLGLMLFILCRPADGAKTSKASGGSTAAATTGKTKRAATVNKPHARKKTHAAQTRRVRDAKTRKAKTGTKAAIKTRRAKTGKSAKAGVAATGKPVGGAAKTSVQPLHSPFQTSKGATGKMARESAQTRPILLSSPVRRDNASSPSPGARWVEPRTGMAFRWIPAGCFVMGSPKTEHGRERDEGPQHKVCLSGFWMGETEVTQGQWTAIMGGNPSLIKNGNDHPVDMISWKMARDYALALDQGSEDSYRLPTEAEWEYACRAGTDTAYFFGDKATKDQATFDKPFVLPLPPLSPGGTRRSHARKPAPAKIWPNMHTTVVGSYPANAFGLFDMHGNLWEWCEDVYDAGFYACSPRDNPLRLGEGKSRVIRGGSWVTRAESLRSANRGYGWPDMRTAFYGLRLVRIAKPEAPQPPANVGTPTANNTTVPSPAPSESKAPPIATDKPAPAASGPDKPAAARLPGT